MKLVLIKYHNRPEKFTIPLSMRTTYYKPMAAVQVQRLEIPAHKDVMVLKIPNTIQICKKPVYERVRLECRGWNGR